MTRPMSSAWCGAIALTCAIALTEGCSPEGGEPRPSIVLVVIDTLRADAVSAYGAVEGTTPAFDALASRGLLYERAYAPSPWTLPSHASLLTGFEVDRHGVGIAGRMGLRAEFTTLAERLSDAGYQTVGFSENPLVSGLFGFDQGFERFSAIGVDEVVNGAGRPDSPRFDIVREVAAETSATVCDVDVDCRRFPEGVLERTVFLEDRIHLTTVGGGFVARRVLRHLVDNALFPGR